MPAKVKKSVKPIQTGNLPQNDTNRNGQHAVSQPPELDPRTQSFKIWTQYMFFNERLSEIQERKTLYGNLSDRTYERLLNSTLDQRDQLLKLYDRAILLEEEKERELQRQRPVEDATLNDKKLKKAYIILMVCFIVKIVLGGFTTFKPDFVAQYPNSPYYFQFIGDCLTMLIVVFVTRDISQAMQLQYNPMNA